jgi:hypothetical protein
MKLLKERDGGLVSEIMGFENLGLKFGERILAERGYPYDRVLHTDFTVDWFHGTEVTPGDTTYNVRVTYLRGPDVLVASKDFPHLGAIIKELEDIDEQVRFD